MRLSIRYVTTFNYPGLARESHNALRARPADDGHQRVLDYRVTTDPSARILGYHDYWGTWVDVFGVRTGHRSLTIVAESLVDTSDRSAPDKAVDPGSMRGDAFLAEHWQYLQPSPHARWGEAIASRARHLVEGAEEGRSAIEAIHDEVHGALEYVPGATFVGVDVNDVLFKGQGVCQDFAHLAIAMYRSAGIPARYVSGYLYASDQATGVAPTDAEIDVQTHAWVEVAVPGFGWWGLDPTNPQDVGPRHVKIGHGRDYDDTPPLRGVYHGDPDHELAVSVSISRNRLSAFQQTQEQ